MSVPGLVRLVGADRSRSALQQVDFSLSPDALALVATATWEHTGSGEAVITAAEYRLHTTGFVGWIYRPLQQPLHLWFGDTFEAKVTIDLAFPEKHMRHRLPQQLPF